MDALGLINLALMRIGERAIADVNADSTAARVASSFFTHSVDEVTSEHQWTFARKRVELDEDEDLDNLTEYAHAYPFPTDALRILSMVGNHQYMVEGGYIYSNQEDPVIVYIKKLVVEDEDPRFTLQENLPPKFLEAVACRLGMKIAQKIGADQNLRMQLLQEYAILLRQAMGNDAMDSPGRDEYVEWWYE